MTLLAKSKLQLKTSSLIIDAESSIPHLTSIGLFALPQLIGLTEQIVVSTGSFILLHQRTNLPNLNTENMQKNKTKQSF